MNKSTPLIKTGLSEQEFEEYARLCATLAVEFNAEILQKQLPPGDFEHFKQYSEVRLRNYIRLEKIANTQLLFTTVFPKLGESDESSYEQIYGYVHLNNDFGKVFIRPETLIDRVIGFLKPVEARITHDRKFDKSFHILASDEFAIKENMTGEFRNAIKAILLNDFFIEINGNELLIGDRKPWDIDTAREMAEFVLKAKDL